MSYVEQGSSPKRFIGIGLVLALHVALIYALMSGLAREVVEKISEPIEVEIIETAEAPPEEPPPPPPPPEFEPPPAPFVPMPELAIKLPEPPKPPEKTITQVQTKVEVTPPPAPQQPRNLEPVKETPPPPPPAPKGTPVRADPNRPNTQPDYPNAARRREMEGVVVLNLLVDPNGRVRDAKVLQSSGFELLDRAALRHAMREWRFLPATEGGEPVQKWFRFAVEFKLEG